MFKKTLLFGSRFLAISMLLFVLVGSLQITPALAAGIRYAKPAASGSGDCSSWANACTLQTALTGASSGDEIWVMAGTYHPTMDTDRTATFQLKNDVALYGGFMGTETLRTQRDVATNLTILSGDIGAAGDNADNSYQVVTGATGATLDGFTITAGNANSESYPGNMGGGMYNEFSDPILTNVIFRDNSSSRTGAGMYNEFSNPILTNVVFSSNTASDSGGGMYNEMESNPTLTNVTFSANTAGFAGGGMYNSNSSPTLTHVTFSANTAAYYSGGMHNEMDSNPILTNVTFSANSAGFYGGGMSNEMFSNPTLTNVTFSANSAVYGGGALYFSDAYPTIQNSIFWNNIGEPQIYDDYGYLTLIDSVVQGGCPTDADCSNIITADPKLGVLGNYGGFTQTVPLQSGSSAIYGAKSSCPVDDQRGNPRLNAPTTCDIGAYELDMHVFPDIGLETGGTLVTITGADFTGATGVSFGGVMGTAFNLVNPTTITVNVPAHTAGAVDVVVIGTSVSIPNGYIYVGSPTITRIAPAIGVLSGGTSVIITGTNLTNATSTTFGGIAAVCTAMDDSHLSCTNPAHAVGAVNVVVTTPYGTATSTSGFTYNYGTPTLTSIVPNSDIVGGGKNIVITGTNLTGVSSVTFGGTTAACTLTNDTHLSCTSPAHTAGAVNVVVTTPGGMVTSSGAFTYTYGIPTITNMVPDSGQNTGGTSLVITGTNLTSATSFTFGGTTAVCTATDDAHVSCASPAHAMGAVDVAITTPGGTATVTGGFTYFSHSYALTVPGTVFSYLTTGYPATLNIATGLTATSAPSDGLGTISGAVVIISSGFHTGDKLDATASGGVTRSYNSTSGVLTLSGTADISVYQTVLSTVNFSTNSTDTTPRKVTYSLGSSVPYSSTGHFFEYVPTRYTDWNDARKAASTRSYFGRTGYLATINDAGENAFATTKLGGAGAWLGGSDIITDGTWRWMTGPEAGSAFCISTGYGANNCAARSGWYTNWAGPSEPNGGTGENYLQFTSGDTGIWNDLNYPNTSGMYSVSGYVVEYGDMPGDNAMNIQGNVTVNVRTNAGQSTPTITWNNPASIVYRTPLSATQLNATASVPGTLFTYTPPIGTVLNVGPHTLHVDFTPSTPGSYTNASKDVTIIVTMITPTITFGPAPTPIYKGGDFIVSASTTNTDSPYLTFSMVSGPCAYVGGSTFSSTGPGTCVVQADGTATINFGAAAPQTQSITIAPATPLINFAPAPTPAYLSGNFTVSASTTNTDDPTLTYSVQSGPCALVSGATFSSSGAGACVVQADGAATANYNAASQTQNVTISKLAPAITFDAAPTPTYLGADFNVSASTTNTDSPALTYSKVSGPCSSVSGTAFSSTGAGTCVVQANSMATSNYTAATQTQSITIDKATPTISFDPAPTPTYLGGSFTVSAATTNTDIPTPAFSKVSGPCTWVSGAIFNSTGAGTCVVQADGAATTNFTAAAPQTQSITIGKASPVITFDAAPTPTYLGGSFNVNAATTNTDDPALTYSFQSGPCTFVSGAGFDSTGAGTCVVQADAASTTNFLAASQTQSISIVKAAPVITFVAAPTPTYLGGNFTVNASTTNTDSSALTYSKVNGPCAFVSGADFSSTGAGDCVVQADAAATTNFLAASQAQSVSIGKATPTINFNAAPTPHYLGGSFNVSASTTNTDSSALAYSKVSGPCAFEGGSAFSSSDAGTCVVQADQAATTNFTAAAPQTQSIIISPAIPKTCYVNQNASGSNTGASWTDAFTSLQSALPGSDCTEVWVAAGTYTPGTLRTSTFQLKNGVALYGGFAGAETLRTQRNPTANVTLLSGEIGAPGLSDNTYHVVTGATGATLDGFTITAGNADGGFALSNGGGMSNTASSPVLSNLVISGNSALRNGGGMMNFSDSAPTLTNVTFFDNTAAVAGGGMFIDVNCFATLTNVTFITNSSVDGGGLYNFFNSSSTLTNVTFTGNTATHGGAIYNLNTNLTMNNVTLVGNSASVAGGGMYNETFGNPTLHNAILWGNTAPSGPQVSSSGGSTPVLADSIIQAGCPLYSTCTNILSADPQLGSLGAYGGLTYTIPLLPGSSAIDTGNPAFCPTTDQRGAARAGTCDIGAFESQGFTFGSLTGTPQSAIISSPFASPLDLGVTANAAGEPVEGGIVTFTPPASGPGAVISGSPATILDGLVSVTPSANATLGGPYHVTASTSGAASVDFVLTNVASPTISGVNPNADLIAGGKSVLITGTNLTGGTVTFGVTSAACTVNSDTQITCTSPAHTAGTVDVIVTAPGGTQATSTNGFTYYSTPVYTLSAAGTYSYVSNASAMNIGSSLTAVSAPTGYTIDGAIVVIGSGFHAGDTLGAAVSGGVTKSYNAASGVLTLSGTASISVYQTILQSITFSTNSAVTTPRTITYSLGTSLPYSSTGHFFEYVPVRYTDWNDAKNAAAARTYFGRNGYLATINDAGENAFATTKLNGAGAWLGGSDAATEGTWRWMTGPEAGNAFCVSTGSGINNCAAKSGWYVNWNADGEPNGGTTENYLQFTSGGTGRWNDLTPPGSGQYGISGYVVEYGGMPGDTPMTIQGNVTVNVLNNAGQSTPVITWNNPGDLTFGTTLSAAQLNATSGGIAGSFVYTPAAGATLNVGPHTLHVDFTPTDTTNYTSASKDVSITITQAAAVITFGAAPTPTYLGGSFTVSASTTNTDSSALTYSKVSGPCTWVSGATFSNSAPGTCVVQADGIATTNFAAAAPQTQSVTISKITPTITFGAAPTPTYLGANFTVNASTSNFDNLALTYSVQSGPCAWVSGATFSSTGAGACVVQASGAATTNFTAGSQTQLVTIAKANQASLIVVPVPSTVVYGGTSSLSFTGGSGTGAVTYSSDLSSGCSVAGNVLSVTDASGTCAVTATKAADTNFNSSTSAPMTVTLSKAAPVITWANPANIVYGTSLDGTQLNAASGGIDGTFTYTPAVGAVLNAGPQTLHVDFTPTGANNYTSASKDVSITVTQADQSISFTSLSPVSAMVSGLTYTPTAAGGASGNAVIFTIDGPAASVCSILDGEISFLAAGTCVIDANQPGSANYNPAPQVQQSFAVGKGSQVINFTSTAPVDAVVDGVAYTPTASGGASGSAVIFTIDPSAASVCHISSGQVSFLTTGTCVIDANQAGSANYMAAPQVQQSFAVDRGSQAILFTSLVPSGAVVDGITYTPIATGGASGSAVTFIIDASSAAVCSLAGGQVSFHTPGTCTIDANQAGDINYLAAPQVQQFFAVGKGSQTILFTSPAPVSAVVAGTPYMPIAAGGASNSAVLFTIDDTSSSVCSISGSSVSFLTAGLCVIDANQAGDANYNAAPQVQQSFNVGKATPLITFDTAPTPTYLGGSFTVSASTTNTDSPALTYSRVSGPCAWVSGATFSTSAPGTCVVRADGIATSNYTAAFQTQSVTIAKADQAALTVSAAPSAVVYGSTAALSTSGGTGTGAVTFSAGASTGCSVTGSTLSVTNASGTCDVTATKAADTNYLSTTSAPLPVTLLKANQASLIVVPAPSTVVYGSTAILSTTGGSGTGSVSYDAGASSGCTVLGSTLSVTDASGTCAVTATKAADTNFNSSTSAAVTVTLSRANSSVTLWPSASAITFGQTLASSTLTGGTATPAGTFAFTTPAASPAAGTASQAVTFTPDDTANYNPASGTASVTVHKANPDVTAWPAAIAITFGQTLASSTLTGGASTPAGSFAFTTPSIAPAAGTASQAVTFTPSDTANYNNASGATSVTVNKANSNVTLWPSASAITFGQTLASSSLTGGASTPAGTFAFTTPSTAPATGTALQAVTFTPTDTDNYNPTAGSVNVTVNKANSNVTAWPVASPIRYGQTLADSILTGGSSIPVGSFAFTAPALSPNTGTASQSVTFTPNDTANYNPASGTVNVTVDKADQAVLTAVANPATVVYGSTALLSATGGTGTGSITFSTGVSTGCSVAGNTLSVTNASGSCAVTATKAADTHYNSATSAGLPVTLSKAAPVITWANPANITYGTALSAAQLNATANVPGTFAYTPALGAVLTGGAQTLHVDLTPDDANDYSIASKDVSITVNRAGQSITFTSSAPANAVINGSAYTPTATGGGSANPVIITIDASAAAVCSISAGVVSFQASGSCVVDANQAGDTNYNAAAQIKQTFTVSKISQTISFTSSAPAGAVVNGSAYTPSATGGASGKAVIFTIDASAASVCSISGGVISFQTPGSCVIDANQAGDVNFYAAPQVQQSFAVGKGSQIIIFTSTAPAGAVVAGTAYTPTAAGGASGSAVVFTIDASAASVCSISAGHVSFQTTGSCVIDANQAGSANYNAAPQAQQSFAVGKGAQSISFTSTVPSTAVAGGTFYTPAATGGASGSPIIFSIDASAASVCAISAGHVSFMAVGTCVIDANQTGNVNYNAALQVQQSFAVGKGSQSISMTSLAPTSAIIAGTPYTPTATGGGSTSPVVFTIDASAASICSIAGGNVSFLASGTCVLNANQAGDANYFAAPQVQQSFAVSKITPVITFDTAPTPTFLGSNFTVHAVTTNTDNAALSYSKVSGSCAFLGGATFKSTGAGTCIVRADSLGTTNFKAAAQTQHINIERATLTINVTNSPTYNGAAQPAVLSVGSVAGTFRNILYDGSPTVPVNAGTYAVTADFTPLDTVDYNPLVGVSAGSFVIHKVTPVLVVTNSPVLYNSTPQAAVISAGSALGAISNVQYDGSSTVPTQVGIYAVTADFAPADTVNFNSLTGVSVGSFEIGYNPETLTITWSNPADIVYSTALDDNQLNASVGNVPGVFDYTPGPGTVLSVGTHTLHVVFTPDDLIDYTTSSKDVTIRVTQAATTTSFGTSANPVPFGQSVTFTAIVASDAGIPDGTVTFKDGSRTLGTGTLSDGIATLTTNGIETGSRTITATYNSAGNYAASVSDSLSQTITPVDAAISLTSTPHLTLQGQTWIFKVTITLIPSAAGQLKAASQTNGASAGTVILKDGNTTLATSLLAADGTATFTITNFAPGTHHITAEFSEGVGSSETISDPVVVKKVNLFQALVPFIKK